MTRKKTSFIMITNLLIQCTIQKPEQKLILNCHSEEKRVNVHFLWKNNNHTFTIFYIAGMSLNSI